MILVSGMLLRSLARSNWVIIEAYPKGACIPDHLGAYALHKMCDYGCSVEALRVVLQYPEACSTITKVEGYFHRKPLNLLNWRRNMGEFHDQLVRARALRQRQRILQQNPVLDIEQWMN